MRIFLASLLLLTSIAFACLEPHAGKNAKGLVIRVAPKVDNAWLGPWTSGAWFDPARSGEGIILQYLPDGRTLLVFFTYPAVGEPGQQAWLLGQDARITGNTMRFEQVVRPQGARFGDAFNPAQVQLTAWGSINLRFDDCDTLQLSYQGPTGYGSGSRTLKRLTSLEEAACTTSRKLTSGGARRLEGLRSKSGAWFVSSRSGEGWLVEELPDGRTLAVYWFTYDPQGNQAWTIGTGTRQGDSLVIEDNLISRGTRFGSNFNANDVKLEPWGRIELTFRDCNSLDFRYASPLAGFGSASRSATRLTSIAGASCIATPGSLPSLSYSEKARSPAPFQTEHAVATDGNALYVVGGFGKLRGFRKYEMDANRWTELPDLPAGRDHPAAFAIGGSVYLAGGQPNGGGDQNNPAYRFDLSTNVWSPVPEIVPGYGSHAVVLNGYAYIGMGDGTVQQYDPVNRRSRILSPPTLPPRDHSQVIAFMDEIWSIGGRTPENSGVSIYDPSTERWRDGPPFRARRGGFAAAVVGPRIVIAGGEILSGIPFVIEPSTEILVAGSDTWNFGPVLPVPVHGTVAGVSGNRFFLISGSTLAGQGSGATGRVFEMVLPSN
jgi:N-acetylneuraminic acid mutarotase